MESNHHDSSGGRRHGGLRRSPDRDSISSKMSLTNVEVAETYINALSTKDPTKALLAPEVTLQYPLSPRRLTGPEMVMEYMSAMMPSIDRVEVERYISEDDYVVTLWQAHTVWGVIPVCHVFRIADEMIHEIRSFFDARLIGPLR